MRLEKRPRLLVPGPRWQQAVTGQHPARVGVGHEHGAASGVEQDRVRRLGAQSGYGQELAPQRAERRPPQAVEAAVEAADQPARERAQPRGLDPVRPCRADHRGHRGGRPRGEPAGVEQPPGPERGDRPGGVAPGRVLREDGARRHLEGGAGRPPALGTETLEQGRIESEQPGLDRIARRAGRSSTTPGTSRGPAPVLEAPDQARSRTTIPNSTSIRRVSARGRPTMLV